MKPDETGRTPPQPTAPSPILFLDTNGIHYARLALSLARTQHRKILKMDNDEFKAAIKRARVWKGSEKPYMDGFAIGHYLAKRVDESDARVQYAPVSGFELLCGGLRGRAIVNAARGRVPNRWYSRLDEAELLHYLNPGDFAKNDSDRMGISDLFQGQLGFTVGEADERDIGRVFDLSKSILKATFLEIGDCLVYASSMLARAEAVITCDSHLANVIRSVENPGSNPELAKQFNRASKIIRECVAAILEVQASQVSLPKALKIKDMTQKKSQRGAG